MTSNAVPPPPPIRGGSVFGLPARVGQILTAPRAAMERIDREGGGLTDALWLVVVGSVTFRIAQLLEAALGATESTSGAFMRVAAVVSNELVGAAWIVLPAAILVTILAGARRDSSRDLELGAACYAPYFTVRALARALEAVTGGNPLPQLASEIPAVAAALVVLARAVLVARARVGAPQGASPEGAVVSRPPRAALVAGLAVMAVAVVGLAGNATWSSRNFKELLPIRHGQTAPAFTLARADGTRGQISLAALRGRVVVLDFWATWCPPCLAMLPTLHELHAEWSDRGVAFVGVNSDGGIEPEALRAFLTQHAVPYPVGIDEGDIGSLYKVRSLPTLFVIGKDGTIRASFVGLTRKATLTDALEAASR
ncbi:MAG TPA: redoxin domain-containing protein [Polyangia bacterium]|jgi:thiol-disulfide isomerase/thioredoxin|nr:redoxin domain-containing protein [Polyangia bacterium]